MHPIDICPGGSTMFSLKLSLDPLIILFSERTRGKMFYFAFTTQVIVRNIPLALVAPVIEELPV